MEEKQQIAFDFSHQTPVVSAQDPAQSLPVQGLKQQEEALLPKKRGRKPKDPTLVIKKEPGKRGRKSLKEAAAAAELVEIPEDDILFRKQYYTMGEVAEMFSINHSLIRLWESQFPILQPKKNKKGDRYFRPIDIKNLYLIHNLVRQRKYTIEGAQAYLKNVHNASAKFEMIQSLQKIKSFLLEIQANL